MFKNMHRLHLYIILVIVFILFVNVIKYIANYIPVDKSYQIVYRDFDYVKQDSDKDKLIIYTKKQIYKKAKIVNGILYIDNKKVKTISGTRGGGFNIVYDDDKREYIKTLDINN